MTSSLIILGLICLVLAIIAFAGGGATRVGAGLSEAMSIFAGVAPQLALGFLMAGFVTILVPQQMIARLVGAESGTVGLGIATLAGAVTPGGPFLQFPLVATLLRSGAGEGQVAAYLTAWSLLGLQRVLVWEVPVLGPTFAITRWGISLVIPILVGLAVPLALRAFRPVP